MELKLDSINRRKVKYCPCGKSNKDGKFVPFKNAEKYGYCHSCDKWMKPDNKPALDWRPIKLTRRSPDPKPEYISWEYYKPLMYDYHLNDNNRFIDFLCRILGVQETHYILQDYMLGTGKNYTVIFPYLDTTTYQLELLLFHSNFYGRSLVFEAFPAHFSAPNHQYKRCYRFSGN